MDFARDKDQHFEGDVGDNFTHWLKTKLKKFIRMMCFLTHWGIKKVDNSYIFQWYLTLSEPKLDRLLWVIV